MWIVWILASIPPQKSSFSYWKCDNNRWEKSVLHIIYCRIMVSLALACHDSSSIPNCRCRCHRHRLRCLPTFFVMCRLSTKSAHNFTLFERAAKFNIECSMLYAFTFAFNLPYREVSQEKVKQKKNCIDNGMANIHSNDWCFIKKKKYINTQTHFAWGRRRRRAAAIRSSKVIFNNIGLRSYCRWCTWLQRLRLVVYPR